VYLTFQFTEHERGKGTWKFNNRLLRDEEYIKIVKDCIDEVIGQYKTEDNEKMFDIRVLLSPSMFHLALGLIIIPLTFSSLIFFNSDSNLEISSSGVPPF
jgi:hypothetical protein